MSVAMKYEGHDTLDDHFASYEEFEEAYIRRALIKRIEQRLAVDSSYKTTKFMPTLRRMVLGMVSTYNDVAYAFWKLMDTGEPTVFSDVALNLYTYIPFAEACFCSHRPTEVHMENGDLHCNDGMAVKYADGYGRYALYGVTVDEKLILRPETQTLDEINGEGNITIKRERMARYGWLRYLEESDATIIDESVIQGMETLFEVKSGGETLVLLLAHDNSTLNLVPLEVDPSCRTCAEAQRYLMGDDTTLSLLGLKKSEATSYPVART